MKGPLVIIGASLIVVLALIGFMFFEERSVAQEVENYNSAIETPRLIVRSAQAFILSPANINYLPIRDFNISEPIIDARAAIVHDIRSGRTLYALNPDEQMPIASITKLMTAVVITENLDLDSIYTISAQDLNVDGLGADLYRGEQILGRDLLKVMLINSANDAASVFSTEIAKTGYEIVDLMNEKAHDIGMDNTHFNDPAGLDDGATYSTASDVVTLVRYVNNYPEIWEILATENDEVASLDGKLVHKLNNTNRLLGIVSNIIGGKTGRTEGALGTLALVVDVNDGKDAIITVVLGAEDRFGETQTLINWVKNAHTWK
ncbi:MAG: serine hydrolase [Parcubacteria group bacterium]